MSIEAVGRKSGKVWRVRWRDPDGRERSRVIGPRRKDAELFEADLVRRRRLGQLADIDSGHETLGEFVETWWASYAVPNLAEYTRLSYAGLWDRHIEDRLGHYRLCDLRPGVIEDFAADLARAGVGDAQVRRTLVLLQGVLRRAVERELIARNPVVGIRKPPQRRKREPQLFDPNAIEQMRRTVLDKGDVASAVLICALGYAGLRPGEALALRWDDIRDRTLRVDEAVSLGKVKETKTGQIRAVTLVAPLIDDLAAYEKHQPSGNRAPRGLLFRDPDGEPWSPTRWRSWRRWVFDPAAEAAGITGSRPYDLRHSFVSLLIQDGRNVVEVAAQAGHAPTLCLSTYAHLFAEGKTGEGTVEERIFEARRRLESLAEVPGPVTNVSDPCQQSVQNEPEEV